MKLRDIFISEVYLPGHATGLLRAGEFAHLEPMVDRGRIDSQSGRSPLNRVAAVFPLGRIVLFSVDLDGWNVPFFAQ